MTTLSLLYKQKDQVNSEISTRKTYFLPLNEIYIEPGYNIREIDQEHAEEFRDAFINGEPVPPITVMVTEKGAKIVDGHHRYKGALLATEAGHEIPRLECKDFVGTEADRIAFMVTSSQGRPLSPLERAAAYQRMINQGWEPAEIAKKVKRSVTDIDHHLQLLASGDTLIEMVKVGEVSATTAVSMSKEYGAKAGEVAKEKIQKAKAEGKKKITRADAIPQFNAVKSRRLVELMASFEFVDGSVNAAPDAFSEAMAILDEYRNKISKAEKNAVPEKSYDENLPLTKTEMIMTAGPEVWACASAAFGDKEEFTFNESRYAHTWASDSLPNPELVTVAIETRQKAEEILAAYHRDRHVKLWLEQQLPITPEGMADRFITLAAEMLSVYGLSTEDFLEFCETVDKSAWNNVRHMRSILNAAYNQELQS